MQHQLILIIFSSHKTREVRGKNSIFLHSPRDITKNETMMWEICPSKRRIVPIIGRNPSCLSDIYNVLHMYMQQSFSCVHCHVGCFDGLHTTKTPRPLTSTVSVHEGGRWSSRLAALLSDRGQGSSEWCWRRGLSVCNQSPGFAGGFVSFCLLTWLQ